MATTIKQVEATPDDYPTLPRTLTLSATAAALNKAMVWQRIESYIAFRFSVRDVVWIVEGCGEWSPPLQPATITTIQAWSRAGEWETAELNPSPLGGYWLSSSGPFRFSGTVGDDDSDLPPVVVEAYRRLAEYFASKPGKAGATSEQVRAGSVTVSVSRDPAFMSNALPNSGAADLLRPYRRA